jgi:hypothetical protein
MYSNSADGYTARISREALREKPQCFFSAPGVRYATSGSPLSSISMGQLLFEPFHPAWRLPALRWTWVHDIRDHLCRDVGELSEAGSAIPPESTQPIGTKVPLDLMGAGAR